jgi:hypothetical protein
MTESLPDEDSPIRLNLIKTQQTQSREDGGLQQLVMQQQQVRAHPREQVSSNYSRYNLQENPSAHLESGSHNSNGNVAGPVEPVLELRDQESFAAYTRHIGSLKVSGPQPSSGEVSRSHTGRS